MNPFAGRKGVNPAEVDNRGFIKRLLPKNAVYGVATINIKKTDEAETGSGYRYTKSFIPSNVTLTSNSKIIYSVQQDSSSVFIPSSAYISVANNNIELYFYRFISLSSNTSVTVNYIIYE